MCGIYGSLSYGDLVLQFPGPASGIIAVIAAEGDTIIGTRGLRTAYARVVAYGVVQQKEYERAAYQQFPDATRCESATELVKRYGLATHGVHGEMTGFGVQATASWWTTGGKLSKQRTE